MRSAPVAHAVTTSASINFLRKPAPADLIAKTRLIKLGKRLAVGEVALYFRGRERNGRPRDRDLFASPRAAGAFPPEPGYTGLENRHGRSKK